MFSGRPVDASAAVPSDTRSAMDRFYSALDLDIATDCSLEQFRNYVRKICPNAK